MANDINIKTIFVTPEYAKFLLGHNTHNRNVSAVNLANIKASLQRGEWALNGEAIKIAEGGQILDGQHRLLACVETGISFETLIITGLPKETQNTMDTGKVRSPADVLRLAGYPSANTLAAMTAAIIRSEQYSLRAAVNKSASSYPVTRHQILERVKSDPNLIDTMRDAVRLNKIGLPGSVAGVLMYVFAEIDPEDSADFFDRLITGNDMPEGHPILTLRNQLIHLKNVRAEVNRLHVAAITIKAWNKYRAGETARQLRYTPGGANPEKFPEPK